MGKVRNGRERRRPIFEREVAEDTEKTPDTPGCRESPQFVRTIAILRPAPVGGAWALDGTKPRIFENLCSVVALDQGVPASRRKRVLAVIASGISIVPPVPVRVATIVGEPPSVSRASTLYCAPTMLSKLRITWLPARRILIDARINGAVVASIDSRNATTFAWSAALLNRSGRRPLAVRCFTSATTAASDSAAPLCMNGGTA